MIPEISTWIPTLPEPTKPLVHFRNRLLLLPQFFAPKRQKTTVENYLAMSQKEKNGFFIYRRTEKPALPGLKVIHVEGFNIPKGGGGDFLAQLWSCYSR